MAPQQETDQIKAYIASSATRQFEARDSISTSGSASIASTATQFDTRSSNSTSVFGTSILEIRDWNSASGFSYIGSENAQQTSAATVLDDPLFDDLLIIGNASAANREYHDNITGFSTNPADAGHNDRQDDPVNHAGVIDDVYKGSLGPESVHSQHGDLARVLQRLPRFLPGPRIPNTSINPPLGVSLEYGTLDYWMDIVFGTAPFHDDEEDEGEETEKQEVGFDEDEEYKNVPVDARTSYSSS